MEFLIKSMDTAFIKAIEIFLPTAKAKVDIPPFTIKVIEQENKCIISSVTSENIEAHSQYYFDIEIIKPSKKVTPSIVFHIEPIFIERLIRHLSESDLQLTIDHNNDSIIAKAKNRPKEPIQSSLLEPEEETEDSKINEIIHIPLTTKLLKHRYSLIQFKQGINLALSRTIFARHLNNATKLLENKLKKESCHIQIQYSDKNKRLIIYSKHDATILISGFDCKDDSNKSDFHVAITKESAKKLHRVLNEIRAEKLLLSHSDYGDGVITITAGSYSLSINCTEIMYTPNAINHIVKNNLAHKCHFKVCDWFNYLNNNKVSKNKSYMISVAGSPSSKSLSIDLIYQVNSANQVQTKAYSHFLATMPFDKEFQFNLNLSYFFHAINTLQALQLNLSAEISLSISTTPDTILLSCHSKNQLNERYYFLLPFE